MHHLNTFDGGVSRLHGFKSQRGADYPFQFAMIAFNHVVPVLNLSVFNVRRAPAFAFEQSKRATIGGALSVLDESWDLPLFTLLRILPRNRYAALLLLTGGEIKSTVRPRLSTAPVQIRPAAIDLHVGFIHVPRAKIGSGYASTSAAVFPFQAHNAEPSGKSWSDRHSLRVQPASPAAHGNSMPYLQYQRTAHRMMSR